MNKSGREEVLNDIWSANSSKFMDVAHTSQKKILHPTLAKLINEQQPSNLLDYGCGDTRILSLIDKKIAVDVHDINIEMLELAKLKNGKRINNYYQSKELIPTGHYDVVLMSMVLVCIKSEEEYLKVLQNIQTSKKETGRALIAVTHPCFRDRWFSNFHTSYSESYPFKYLKEGEPFDVFIEDETPPSVAFTDYHWTFSFTLNAIIRAGMIIERVIETPDDESSSNYNDAFSTFLVVVAK